MDSLTGAQVQQLQQALLSAFNRGSLEIFLRTELGVVLENIAGGANFTEIVFNVITWAETQGRSNELIQKACEANPGNPQLEAFVTQHLNLPLTSPKKSRYIPQAEQANRQAMLSMVRRYWIEGVLYKSLWNEARLILNLEGRPDAVIHPCDLALLRAGQSDTPIPPGTSILDIYKQEQEELLLLGEPGSGKTTLLLMIAEALLQEAENNPQLPIPVIFNLSTWSKNHTRLDAWLVEQLNQDYAVPKKIATRWVETGALLLMLDGLDEVAERRRAACVNAINAYRHQQQSLLRPMVVCCRTLEYEAIPDLRLSGAVVIKPLSKQQVDDYLSQGGKALAGLRAVLKDEPNLYQELFATPLMLHVAVMTYADQSATALRRSATLEERRRLLWDAYIERMFERKQERKSQYKKAQALAWLAWLGNYLTRKDLQKYLIEGMQPDDLPHPLQTFLVRWLLVLLFGILPFLLFFREAIRSAIVLMLLNFLLAYSRNIKLEPIRRFALRNLSNRWQSTIGIAVFAAVIVTVGATAGGEALLVAVGVAVVVTVRVGLAFFEERVQEDTAHPNEGIGYSLLTAVFVALFGAAVLAAVLAAGTAAGTPTYRMAGEVAGAAASAAAVGAAVGAIIFGGRTVFQHYLLRFLLWRSGQFPLNITAFLDWAVQRALVQRVGSGWRFVHRTLQERFAERYNASGLPDDR